MNPYYFIKSELRASRSIIVGLILLLALSISLSVAISITEKNIREGIKKTSNDFGILVGANGSSVSLFLSSVFLQIEPIALMKGNPLRELKQENGISWFAPLAFGDSYKQHLIVGTTKSFLTKGKETANLSEGRIFQTPNEVVIGSQVNLPMGFSFQPSHGTHTDAHSEGHDGHNHDFNYTVVGKMKASGTPYDNAILVPIQALWITHGLMEGEHNHDHSEEAHAHDDEHNHAHHEGLSCEELGHEHNDEHEHHANEHKHEHQEGHKAHNHSEEAHAHDDEHNHAHHEALSCEELGHEHNDEHEHHTNEELGHQPKTTHSNASSPTETDLEESLYLPEKLHGISSIIIQPSDYASAYELRSKWNNEKTQAVFSGEVISFLFGLMGDIRSLMQVIAAVSQVIALAATVFICMFLITVRKHRLELMETLGAPKSYLATGMISIVVCILGLGVLGGIGFGYGLAQIISVFIQQATGVSLI